MELIIEGMPFISCCLVTIIDYRRIARCVLSFVKLCLLHPTLCLVLEEFCLSVLEVLLFEVEAESHEVFSGKMLCSHLIYKMRRTRRRWGWRVVRPSGKLERLEKLESVTVTGSRDRFPSTA